jgi:hypothetical protein
MLFLIPIFLFCANNDTIPVGAEKIIKNYPGLVVDYKNNYIFFKDGTSLLYDDKKEKTKDQLLNTPDIEDQFRYDYPLGKLEYSPLNELFFKKIYGKSVKEVQKNLVELNWCPKLIGQKILVTKINGVDKAMQLISLELDELPEFKDYLINSGGTFNWRRIAGTKRLSMHSFGMTIDLNPKHANYWQWDCKCTNEDSILRYKNKIPQKVVDIFEKHGFIWGGKWYHYDTMHFEYRPELLK